MICPRCNKPTLDEKERDGVTIDVCRECRGIWLDRGELERLVAMAGRELERYQESGGGTYDSGHRSHDDHHDRHHKDHSYNSHHGHEHRYHKRKNWLAEIFD